MKKILVKLNPRDTIVQFFIAQEKWYKTISIKIPQSWNNNSSEIWFDIVSWKLDFISEDEIKKLLELDIDKNKTIDLFIGESNKLDNSYKKRISYLEKLEKDNFENSVYKYIEMIRDIYLHKKTGDYTFKELEYLTCWLNNISIILAWLDQIVYDKHDKQKDIKTDKFIIDFENIYKELTDIIKKRRG